MIGSFNLLADNILLGDYGDVPPIKIYYGNSVIHLPRFFINEDETSITDSYKFILYIKKGSKFKSYVRKSVILKVGI